jgi:hypothetical protein
MEPVSRKWFYKPPPSIPFLTLLFFSFSFSLVRSDFPRSILCGAGSYRYKNIFYSTWGLLLAGLVFALPMMHMRIKDFTTDEFDYEDCRDPSPEPPPSRPASGWEE